MAYKHGTYGVRIEDAASSPITSGSLAVYIGTAPINLIQGWETAGLINNPIRVGSMQAAKQGLGQVSDWNAFTLCEVFAMHFANTIGPSGPIVVINVLDPNIHKKDEETTAEVVFVKGRATLDSSTIILDTLALENMASATDYSTEYDFSSEKVIITATDAEKAGAVTATYQEVDLTKVTEETIIGSRTESGTYTGIESVDLIYTKLGLIANILAAPGFSEKLAVYQALTKKAEKINGHWSAFVNADLPINFQTITDVLNWKEENSYDEKSAKVYWPKWQVRTGEIYHLSTIGTWLMTLTDAENDGIPMETPSNKAIPDGHQYFGDASTNQGYDQQSANDLNAKGVTTAVFWGGRNVLWGPHTAAYDFSAERAGNEMFDNAVRMVMYTLNSFQEDHADEVDKPMTKAMIETIKNYEQEKADALAAMGAWIGTPVVDFKEMENGEVREGNFVWDFSATATPPLKSATLKVATNEDGYSVYTEGSEE